MVLIKIIKATFFDVEPLLSRPRFIASPAYVMDMPHRQLG
jgi:hypothetical protein